jgi:glutaredoxin 3
MVSFMAEVIMYSTEPCPFCSRAKALLNAREIDFNEVNLAKDPDGRTELAERTGLMTFPQIVIDGETLGGWTELEAADASGRLAELIS